jgi:hypothetical protein
VEGELLNIYFGAIHTYKKDFKLLDEFTALRFTATGAPSAARSMRILPMNQPITFGMK